jgi:ankyrin repeat protein
MLACGRGHVDVVRLLLEAEAPVETRDALGRTALIHATNSGEATVVGMLLEAGADVGVVCGYGGSALHYAAGRGHMPILTTLLTHMQRRLDKEERQAVLNLRQRRGETALHMACGCGRGEGVRALLLAGAEPSLEDEEGGTCLDAARQGEHAHIEHILQVRTITEEKGMGLLIAKGLRGLWCCVM